MMLESIFSTIIDTDFFSTKELIYIMVYKILYFDPTLINVFEKVQ